MALEGLHHVTAITADAQRNVDFYVGRLGLRFVKKTVNFDAPDVYHLYFGDESASPGSILTFFEFPGAAPGRTGAGEVYRVAWRVGSGAALDHWAQRLEVEREGDAVVFADPEGLQHELVVDPSADASDLAIQGFAGVRAYASDPSASAALLRDGLGFSGEGAEFTASGEERSAFIAYDAPPPERASQGAGSVHHVAWSVAGDAELELFRGAATRLGAHATPIIDRQYFHSVYFREPSGVLFELASRDIGFTVDEPLETLGEALKLPPQHEPLRASVEARLTPLHIPDRA